MTRLSVIVLALALATAVSPASAVITWDNDASPLPPTPFQSEFYTLDNTPLSISDQAWVLAVFAGQSWGYTPKAPNEDAPWEYPVGSPTPNTPLALFGQYQYQPQPAPPIGPNPVPVPTPTPDWRDPNLAQNVGASHGKNFAWFGGLVDDFYFYGTTSILFNNNINTFTTDVLDSGRFGTGGTDPNDLGGPIHFAFFGRDGQFLQQISFANAKDGIINFHSTSVDIAGVQIWHEDQKGLEFRSVAFGVTPTPATLALILLGLAALSGSKGARVRGVTLPGVPPLESGLR